MSRRAPSPITCPPAVAPEDDEAEGAEKKPPRVARPWSRICKLLLGTIVILLALVGYAAYDLWNADAELFSIRLSDPNAANLAGATEQPRLRITAVGQVNIAAQSLSAPSVEELDCAIYLDGASVPVAAFSIDDAIAIVDAQSWTSGALTLSILDVDAFLSAVRSAVHADYPVADLKCSTTLSVTPLGCTPKWAVTHLFTRHLDLPTLFAAHIAVDGAC